VLHTEAVAAALRLSPALLLKDAGLTIREEEDDLAVSAGQLLARGLCALLGLAAVSTARRLRPTLLLEEDLVLAREGEGAAAVDAGQVKVLGQSRAVAVLCPRSATASGLHALLVGLLLSRLALSLGLGLLGLQVVLQLLQPLGRTCEQVTHLLGVVTDREAVKCVVAVGLGLEDKLLSDERHFVCGLEKLGGKGTVIHAG